MRSTKINLKQSICTDTPVGADLWQLGDQAARHLVNTGMERNGGLTPIYEKETTFATAGLQSLYTKSGDLLQVDTGHNVRINNSVIGNVGPYAVSSRGTIKGYSDAAWSASNTIIGIVKIGSAIRVDEYNPATGTVINTRSTTFNMPTVAITNVVLVKYIGMNFADSLIFVISNNSISYFLAETAAPAISTIGGQAWTPRTLASGQYQAITWSPQLLLFAGVSYGGAVTSPDGITWTTRTLEANTWQGIAWSPQLSLFVAVGGGVGGGHYAASSPDGINWTTRTLAASSWASVTWSPQLGIFVAVGQGAGGQAAISSNGTSWSVQTLEVNGWTSVCWSPQLSLFVAVGGGLTHYAATSPDGVTWALRTIEVDSWTSVCWSPQLSLFVAVGWGPTHYVATSSDGITWIPRTALGTKWNGVTWSPQLSIFVAVGGTTNFAMSSSDGINWTIQTIETDPWTAVAWSPYLNMFAAVATNTGGPPHVVATAQQIILSSNICWKFAVNKFIIGNQGVNNSFAIGDIAATMTAITDATWCAIDIFQGTAYSRAILSFPVKKNASNLLTGIGEVGYNQVGTYSATPAYYGVALAAVTVTIGSHAEGPGYSEATFTRSDSGTNIYYYLAPIMQHNPGQWYDYQQSQTQTLCNGYGRLSDFQGNALGNTCSLRIMMEAGIPTTITAGQITQDGAYDALGVPITNIGEFDEFFLPHVTDNGSTRLNCIYRFNGVLFYFVIQSGATNTLQAVSDNIYMANCLSPINAIDVQNRTLNLGSNDYNGRILFRSSAAIVASQQVDGIIQNAYTNSSDTPAKFITQTFSTTTNIVPGIELPSFVDRAVSGYGVNIYLGAAPSPGYSTTYQAFNVVYINPIYVGTVYVADTRIPFAMGYIFYVHTMQTEIETIFTGVGVIGSANINYDYVGYEIGNDTPGQFQSFVLYGQEYIFDGTNIWLASFNGSLFSGKGSTPIAVSTGLTLIAASPTEVFFLSASDNSLYSYGGGRTISKQIRMNTQDAISSGVFNTRDNSLLLNGSNSFIWIRDGVISENPKKTNQAGALGLFDTINGIQIANATIGWQYTFFTQAGATIVPFIWESGYLGITENKLGVFADYVYTLYSSDKLATSIMFTFDGFDIDGEWHEEVPVSINPGDWTPLGFYRGRIVPTHTLGLALAFGLRTLNHIVLVEVVAEFTPSVSATTSAARSQ